ncbi:hypothetical protein KKG41_00855 [Patescibacteria group bacterium]|nr:hypothetical protein [Patescibacteria group bacterium]MBU1891022.1 hypothetical protein [Patescibacteria group bacterium]
MKSAQPNPMFSNNEGIRLISYCPLCNTQYNPLSAKVLEEKDDAHLVHINCKKCNSSIVALILSSALGVSSVGLLTDLSGEDALRFKKSSRVNDDDVINLYSLLHLNVDMVKYLSSSI